MDQNTPKLKMYKDKHLIYIVNNETGKKIRYDLKAKVMEAPDGDEWVIVRQQYRFFKGLTLADVECPEDRFKRLVHLCSRANPNCKSLSSFICRLEDVLVYENYIREGINATIKIVNEWDDRKRRAIKLTKPLDYYPKHVIDFLKKSRVEVNLECV